MSTVAKGHIERLPSGSYRVRVYAGTDPVTAKERRLKRTAQTEARAAQELAKLLRTVEAGRAPDDSATLGLALDRYLEVADLGVSTRLTHESYIRRIIRPVLGDVRLRNLGPDSLDALYAHLKRCSRLCGRLQRLSTTPGASTPATSAAARCATTARSAHTGVISGVGCTNARRWRPDRS
jgi:hypothetical protein